MKPSDVSQRHLVSSELFREDQLEANHEAVWGSFYDVNFECWGYACCRGTARSQPCTTAKAAGGPASEGAKQPRRARRGDSSESESPRRVQGSGGAAVDWSAAPSELLPPGSAGEQQAAVLIEHIVRFAVGAWQRELNTTPGMDGAPENKAFGSAEMLRQAQEALTPLLKHLRTGAVEGSVLARLREMLELAAAREYAAANKVYMELTVGNKRWQNVVAGAQGLHNKGASIRLIPQSKLNAFDCDPAAQKYILALRRIILFLQYTWPNEDVSKHM